jgi:PAS domain S-box-containing protein
MTSADERSVARDPRIGAVVSVAVVAGVIAAVLTVALDLGRGMPIVPVSLSHTSLLIVLALTTTAGELTAVRLRHGNETEELTLFETAVLADALLLRPREAVAVMAIGLMVASVGLGRPLMKSLFNLGTHTLATAAMLLSVGELCERSDPFGPQSVFGVVLGAFIFGAIDLLGLSLVLWAAGGVPALGTLRESWRLSITMAVGTAAVAATTVAIAGSAPWLLPFTLLPAAALTYAYGAVAQEGDQRLRSQQLLALGHLLAGPVEVEDLITSFLAYVREAFRAETAFIVLETAGREETVVVAHELGADIRYAAPTERLLLATTESTNLHPQIELPGGSRRVLSAPLDAENRRLGLLALTEPVPPRTLTSTFFGTSGRSCRLGAAEATLLGPLASALAAALRGAEHLARSQDETDKLKAVIEDSSDGIVVLDQERLVTVWNPSMEVLTGLTKSAAMGRPLEDLVQTVDQRGGRTDLVAQAWDTLTPEAPRSTTETTLLREDGEQRWVRWAHAAVFDEDSDTGRTLLVRDVVLVHDVTRERQVERLKQDFLATVSHELRSPLTPIKGYVDLLRRKGDEFTPEKRKECLDVVNDRVAHLARLVEDVLLASRVTVPASTVQMGTADLVALARKTVGDFAVEAARIHLDLPPRSVAVACDPVRVVQVVSNLISNALKYSPSTSPVFVAVRADQDMARLSVTDHGRGIPADQLEAIFEKFHRVEDPMRMTTGGTGLGLFIARQLAEAMGATLQVTTSFGTGSTFTFALPLLADGEIDAEEGGAWPTRRFGRPPFPMTRHIETVDGRSTS